MRKLLIVLLTLLMTASVSYAQKITDSGYRIVGYIKSDGTVQDANYRTVGHAKGIPMEWAALYFFFK